MQNLVQKELCQVTGGVVDPYITVVYTNTTDNKRYDLFEFDARIKYDEQKKVYKNIIKDIVKSIDNKQPNMEVGYDAVNIN